MNEGKIVISGVEYNYEDLSDTVKLCIEHVTSLDDKRRELTFKLDEANVAKSGFLKMIDEELSKETDQ